MLNFVDKVIFSFISKQTVRVGRVGAGWSVGAVGESGLDGLDWVLIDLKPQGRHGHP